MFSVTVSTYGINGKNITPSTVKGVWKFGKAQRYSVMAVKYPVFYTVDFDSEEDYLAKKDDFIADFEAGLKEKGIYNENGRNYTISTPITRAKKETVPDEEPMTWRKWHEARKNKETD